MLRSGTSISRPLLFTLLRSDESRLRRKSYPGPARAAIQSRRISFARIHPIFCSSFIENDRHPIVNGLDLPILSRLDNRKVRCHRSGPGRHDSHTPASQGALCREQIEYEIRNGRDLSKKDPPQRRLAYAMRTASKAIALSVE